MTHAELIHRGRLWLLNSKHCLFVTTGKSVYSIEEPDVIGWKGSGFSFLLECKVSRADFFRDGKKHHRGEMRSPLALGNERYYLTPPALAKSEEVPTGWGLLECRPTQIRQVVAPVQHIQKGGLAEMQILLSMIARQCLNGHSSNSDGAGI